MLTISNKYAIIIKIDFYMTFILNYNKWRIVKLSATLR